MCYELLMGQTPFHSYDMTELLQKINDGIYTVKTPECLSIECALFLTQCLQATEANRINAHDLMDHPFLTTNAKACEGDLKLTVLDPDNFHKDVLRATEISQTRQTFTPRLVTETSYDGSEMHCFDFTTQE